MSKDLSGTFGCLLVIRVKLIEVTKPWETSILDAVLAPTLRAVLHLPHEGKYNVITVFRVIHCCRLDWW